ncbi:MAG TPA: hypothetical protein PLJ49_10650 [Smithella sp.]|nr:hypothetical protein [Smithella sp.]HPN86891.1 hypothetical protein [Smithella sp.]
MKVKEKNFTGGKNIKYLLGIEEVMQTAFLSSSKVSCPQLMQEALQRSSFLGSSGVRLKPANHLSPKKI